MPLSSKGREILAAMKKQYGEEQGERVFYASKNAGRIKGVDTKDDFDPFVNTADEDITPTRAPDLSTDPVIEDKFPEGTVERTVVVPVPVVGPVSNLGIMGPQSNPSVPGQPVTMQVGDSAAAMNARNRQFWNNKR